MSARLGIRYFHMGLSIKEVALRFRGIYEAQFRGLRAAGAVVSFDLDRPDASDPADILVCSGNSTDVARAAHETQLPLVLYVAPADQWFDRPLLESLRGRILFAYGTFQSQATQSQYASVGIPYHYLPFAADPELMRPLHLPRIYDVVFLGGLAHRQGYAPYIEPLIQKLSSERLQFVGGGWEKYGIPSQSIAYGSLVNILYNLGRVCINFHSAEQMRGPAIQQDLNNRVFDLAMAGCVQVCDSVEAVRQHFSADEVFAEPTPQAWVQRVFDCLAKPDAQLDAIRAAARRRALAEHTWKHRGRQLLGWIDEALTARGLR